ncbi:MAG: guanylate kinase [Acidobacteriota bacterium]
MSNKGSVLILSAPSGSGKTSLAYRVLPRLSNLRFSVSHTTRKRRRGEENGREYFFVSTSEFEEMIRRDAFLEWANVYGNYYGTSRDFVQTQIDAGIDVLLDIDIQGALKVKELVPEAVMIFVMPPSFDELEARLRGRGLDDEDVIERRLQIARDEIQHFRRYDFVIINRELEQSVAELMAVITASRCRVGRRQEQAERIERTFHAAR